MKLAFLPDSIQIMGEVARELLNPQLRGRILAVVSHAAYLQSKHGELLWVADGTVPLHRRGLRLDGPLPDLEAGSAFRVEDGRLLLGSATGFDFSHAAVWSVPHILLDAAAFAALPARLGAAAAVLRRLPEARGLGRLIPAFLPVDGEQVPGSLHLPDASLLEKARPMVEEIVLACRKRKFHLIPDRAAGLVGLGGGLTPSGDDFLGGLFFSLRLLREAVPGIPGLADRDYLDFIENCQPLTNVISFTILQDHAEGHGLEPLHRLANFLLAGNLVDEPFPIARQLVAVGHSTGWDVLTGFLAGMTAALPQ